MSSGKTGRDKGGKGSKGSGRPSDFGARSKERKAGDAPDQFVMVHQVHKSVSSAVRLIIGHVTVQRWMMVLQIQRSETLELTILVRGLATFLTIPVLKVFESSGRLDVFWISCAVAAISPVQDEDECEARAAFPVEFEGFGALDCGATTSFGRVEGAEASFSKINENGTRIPDVDPYRASHSIWEIVHRQKPRQLTVFFLGLCAPVL